MNVRKVGIAMSGGVDSSVTASILKEAGKEVGGFFMNLPLPGVAKHLERVRAVARQLDIPLEVIDLREPFSREVVDYFVQAYRNGQTPNPCVVCNRQVKFGYLLQAILDRGFDRMATGHYARLVTDSLGRTLVKKGRDPKKDQSYFLCRLTGEQLENVLFPLGSLTKEEVYARAAQLGLAGVHGPESQDVCFLAGETVASFLARRSIDISPGEIVDTGGTVLGQHRGIWHYTIGQRRGLGLPHSTPWYVFRLDAPRNRVVVCKNEMLLQQDVLVRDLVWHREEPEYPCTANVRIRGSHRPAEASIQQQAGNLWQVSFTEPQRALTPGQFAVVYTEDDCIAGSGIIEEQSL